MLRFLTAGESHGPALVAILEGMPSGVAVTSDIINADLTRRQAGFGRGGRMDIEKDNVVILAGIRSGTSLGSPIALLIWNKDWENWKQVMASEPQPSYDDCPVLVPRPGHADLAGAIKYNTHDIRNILERASARETAARCALGAIAKSFIGEFGIKIYSDVISIGSVVNQDIMSDWEQRRIAAERSGVRCSDPVSSKRMIEAIQNAKDKGDSLGGMYDIAVIGLPPGIGSHVHWDKRIDGRLAKCLMSLNAIKGVEIGAGFASAFSQGSQIHDAIYWNESRAGTGKGFYRKSNNAGGIEGGITNGEVLTLRVAMKPIPTLTSPLNSVNILTKEPMPACKERSDVCAVPAAAVVTEAVVALELTSAFLEKFGGDDLNEIKHRYNAYINRHF